MIRSSKDSQRSSPAARRLRICSLGTFQRTGFSGEKNKRHQNGCQHDDRSGQPIARKKTEVASAPLLRLIADSDFRVPELSGVPEHWHLKACWRGFPCIWPFVHAGASDQLHDSLQRTIASKKFPSLEERQCKVRPLLTTHRHEVSTEPAEARRFPLAC
jgi:hypothetical protein